MTEEAVTIMEMFLQAPPGPLGLHVFVDNFVEKANNLVRGSPTVGSAPYKPSPRPDREVSLRTCQGRLKERSFLTGTGQQRDQHD